MNRGSTSGWPSLPSAFVQFGISSGFDRPELIGATLQERDRTGIHLAGHTALEHARDSAASQTRSAKELFFRSPASD
jgi:hypothetical protein